MGRFDRRNPALVTLNEHTAVLDAIALVHYHIPRTRMVAALIDRALPELLEELKRLHPDKVKEIAKMAASLRTHVARQDPLPTGVVDLAQRRHERARTRARSRL